MNPKAIGENSEAQVLARLLRLGRVVLLPFGNNQRYDLLIDDAGIFTRAQVKTGRLKDGVITFYACSTNGFTGAKKGYAGEADIFLVYCPENDEVYRVPVDEVGHSAVALRTEKPKTPHPACRDAEPYLLK